MRVIKNTKSRAMIVTISNKKRCQNLQIKTCRHTTGRRLQHQTSDSQTDRAGKVKRSTKNRLDYVYIE
jgi:hypothetical protein